DQHSDAVSGVRRDGLALCREDSAVDAEQVLALHPLATGDGAHQQRPIRAGEGLVRRRGAQDPAEQGKRAVLQLHGHAFQSRQRGDGPPLVLLHGGPGLSEYLGGLAAELAPAFTVFRYQQRGLEPSVTDGDRSVEGHMADLVRALDGLGWAKPWIAGHSWGGHFAMHFAVAHPERTGALVVIDPLGAVGDGGAEVFGENLM